MTRPIIARAIRQTIRPGSCLRLLLIALVLGPGAGSLRAVDGMAAKHQATERVAAEQALMLGQIDVAVASFQRIAAAHPMDGQTYLLLCRSYYAEGHADEAIAACARAVLALPRSSEAQDWMGRAYGMRAEHAGPIAGLRLALKVKTAFETAVALDASDGAAANDLSEFYINAPGIVGGGQDKAVALADRVAAQLPQQAHRMRALLAEKRKDYATAEREFRAAVEVANRPDAWVDLGAYYLRRGQYDQALHALNQCLALDRAKDASIVDAASLLIEMHREPEVAQQALRDYLASDAKSDAAPVIRVRVMLGKMLAAAGDKAGAKIEFNKALEMASGYAPAKQALREL